MMMREIIEDAFDRHTTDKDVVDFDSIKKVLYIKFAPKGCLDDIDISGKSSQEALEIVYDRFLELYSEKEEFIGSERMREVERIVLLQAVDNYWIDHIDAMDQLRQGIGLRSIGQIDPVIAYKMEGFEMFDEMNSDIREDTVAYLFNIEVEIPQERKAVVDVDALESPTEEDYIERARSNEPKVGRNDDCPCGSGKKYKNCCGR